MIKADTQVCCVIGDPVGHSLSPLIHNAAFQALGLNFVYVAFRVKDVKLAIDGIRGLGIRGVSVTIPHKVSAMKLIDAIDDSAREIGSINTIVNDAGVLKGFNTDYSGALQALEEKTPLKGKKTVLIGAGGVGLAIATGLKNKGAEVVILDIVEDSAKKLAKRVGAKGFGKSDNLSAVASADILINATPVGMLPKVNESVVSQKLLHPKLVVFDVVYNPMETKLIKEAKEAGCTIVYGHKMFLYQAAEQFRLFTGREAPLAEMEKVLVGALKSM